MQYVLEPARSSLKQKEPPCSPSSPPTVAQKKKTQTPYIKLQLYNCFRYWVQVRCSYMRQHGEFTFHSHYLNVKLVIRNLITLISKRRSRGILFHWSGAHEGRSQWYPGVFWPRFVSNLFAFPVKIWFTSYWCSKKTLLLLIFLHPSCFCQMNHIKRKQINVGVCSVLKQHQWLVSVGFLLGPFAM